MTADRRVEDQRGHARIREYLRHVARLPRVLVVEYAPLQALLQQRAERCRSHDAQLADAFEHVLDERLAHALDVIAPGVAVAHTAARRRRRERGEAAREYRRRDTAARDAGQQHHVLRAIDLAHALERD